jgi:prolyl oligopeptidase
MTERPELMKVALPAVGVMDMLRYHTFTAGAGWAYDYGTSETAKRCLSTSKATTGTKRKKAGTHPATMVTTGDHDDRVVPAHSFKFAAELQEKQTGPNPTLIRIEQVGAGKISGYDSRECRYSSIYIVQYGIQGIAKTK